MSALVPCPACSRHVRASEAACPFCSAELPSSLAARAVPAAPRRLERLAAFTFAATVAVTGCSLAGDSESEDTGKADDELGSYQPMYGMPPRVDAGKPVKPIKDAGKDAKPDSAVEDAGSPTPCDAGTAHAMYGMPAFLDGGNAQPMYGMPAFDPCVEDPPKEDGGSMQPMYGMPAGGNQ